MEKVWKGLAAVLMLFVGLVFTQSVVMPDYVEAKSFKGGRSFKMTPRKAPSQSMRTSPNVNNNKGAFSRGLAGGLLGGALGGLLFGSMFGMGGTGMGILPLLLLAGVAYFLFKKFSRPQSNRFDQWNQNRGQTGPPPGGTNGTGFQAAAGPPPPPPTPDIGGGIGSGLKEQGLAQIREFDPGFDDAHFLEVASDVFFQVQAGWMRRDLDSYRHLLGDQLAAEYAKHFEEMRAKGHINKLESIAIRGVEIVEAGSDGKEDFVTVKFTASLLDYIVDDKTGELISGSDTTPVKFEENWTWARPTGTENWKLEGIA